MKFLKANLLDLLALALIGFGLFRDIQTINIILWVYVGLLFLTRIIGFFIPSLIQRANRDNSTPVWFYHLLYLSAVAILIYSNRIELGAAWLLLWVLSWLNYRQSLKTNTSKKGR